MNLGLEDPIFGCNVVTLCFGIAWKCWKYLDPHPAQERYTWPCYARAFAHNPSNSFFPFRVHINDLMGTQTEKSRTAVVGVGTALVKTTDGKACQKRRTSHGEGRIQLQTTMSFYCGPGDKHFRDLEPNSMPSTQK